MCRAAQQAPPAFRDAHSFHPGQRFTELTGSPMPSLFQRQRLRRHADYGLVYGVSRKHTSTTLAFFYRLRNDAVAAECSPRFGITVPRAIGHAVLRNRIKRRLRLAAGEAIGLLPREVDVVLHPKAAVAAMPWAALQAEMADIFNRVARRVAEGALNTPLPRSPRTRKGARR